MNVVDSSGWLEYFADGPNADFFAPAVEVTDNLVIPSISIFEVFKRVLQQRNESDALQVVALMLQGRVIQLDTTIALEAAKISVYKKLPLADSMILATAYLHNAVLWTQDGDFDGLDRVNYKPKGSVP